MLGKPRRQAMQEINSSSMSDIAFLLLVFFLVTTTISMDKGISLIPVSYTHLRAHET